MIRGPITIDPNRVDEARRAYSEDQARYRPELVDDKGMHRAQDPFVTTINDKGEKETHFNRWINAANNDEAQNAWFDDVDDRTGKTIRRPSWQAFPEYTYDKSQGQFDTISSSLRGLQERGLEDMRSLYDKVIGRIG